MKLNLGCGDTVISGFVGVDHRAGHGDLVADAFTLPDFRVNSVSEIVASHILEHACYDRVLQVLIRWREVLVEDGHLWVLVPNGDRLKSYLQQYEEGDISFEYFNSRIFGNASAAREMYGSEAFPGYAGVKAYEIAFHRSLFTRKALESCMLWAGFKFVKSQFFPYREISGKEICLLGVK